HPPRRRAGRRSGPAPQDRKHIPAAPACGRKDPGLGFRTGRLHRQRGFRHGGLAMSVLVLADHDRGALSPATARIVRAAGLLGPVDVLVVAENPDPIAQAVSGLQGVSKVLTTRGEVRAESVVALLETLAVRYPYLLTSDSSVGKDVVPRLAARLDLMPVT